MTTDFAPESSFAAPSSMFPHMVWGSDGDGTFAPSEPAPPPPRSAAALAAATHQLLEAIVAKRVPRVDGLRRKLRDARPGGLGEVDEAVHALHSSIGAVDFLAGRAGGERAADFLRQGAEVAAASRRLQEVSAGFVERHATDGAVARLVWIELVLEADSLRKRVRQGAHWLAQMNRDMALRRAAAVSEVSQRALDELARRGTGLHRRLHTVHRLCGRAHGVHTLCEDMAEQRTALCHTLKAKVRPAAGLLLAALQPLLEAASYRPLVPEELIVAVEARHDVQVCLTQAGAEIIRLQSGDEELSAQLAAMEQKVADLA